MIRPLGASDFPRAVGLIRASFATVAEEFGLTEQNCPRYTAFATTEERLEYQSRQGWQQYGLYEGEQLVGYAALSREAGCAYELHNLAVLPACRHRGYGKQLLDYCKEKVKEAGGAKITIGIIEENTALKNWYAENGFVHTGAQRLEQFPFTAGYMEFVLPGGAA